MRSLVLIIAAIGIAGPVQAKGFKNRVVCGITCESSPGNAHLGHDWEYIGTMTLAHSEKNCLTGPTIDVPMMESRGGEDNPAENVSLSLCADILLNKVGSSVDVRTTAPYEGMPEHAVRIDVKK